MLFVFPFIILCFNFLSINCNVHNARFVRNSRRDIVPRTGHNNSSHSVDTTSNVNLDTPITIINNYIRKNITRVRKQKRRKLSENHNKPVEIVAEETYPRIEKIEENAGTSEKFHVKTNFNLQSGERKVEETNKEEKEDTVLEHILVKATSNIVQENIAKENTTERSNVSTSFPRTFPKRPPEFNPVFKKRRERDPVVRILNEKNFVYGHNGNFHYSFEGGDGTKVYSKGNLISHEERKAGEAVSGGYYYKDAEGNDYSLSYTADQNGYRPVGAHLPTPPPIPLAIARALEYLATKSTPEPVTEEYSYYY